MDAVDLNTTQVEEEKMQERKERLMELLQKSESKKWDFQDLHQVMVDLH